LKTEQVRSLNNSKDIEVFYEKQEEKRK